MAVLGAGACFAPELQDGEIACGTAGCPEGMSCAADGFCYFDPPGEGSSRRVAIAIANRGAPNRLYAYCHNELELVWSDSETRNTRGVAAGDADGDGVPEVAFVAEEDGVLLHQFREGGFPQTASYPLPEIARDLAWGDVNGEYGIDLAIASSNGPVRVLSYHDGQLDALAESADSYDAYAVDADDCDGDGNADVAVGAVGASVVLYEHDDWHGGGPNNQQNPFRPEWSAELGDTTITVDMDDADGDGDRDIAAGNSWQPVRLYMNRGDYFELTWSSPDDVPAESAAWGDIDADGDPDLAVGTGVEAQLRVYRNDGGVLEQIWTAEAYEPTQSIAWADVDDDDDLDLFVGNEGVASRLYLNDGGTLTPSWIGDTNDPTKDVAWVIWDGGPDPCNL